MQMDAAVSPEAVTNAVTDSRNEMAWKKLTNTHGLSVEKGKVQEALNSNSSRPVSSCVVFFVRVTETGPSLDPTMDILRPSLP